jgi:hypothetical protein
MTAAELAGFDAETALVGSKLQVDHEKSGVHLEGAAERRELRRLLALGQHYPSAFNAALVGGGHGAGERAFGAWPCEQDDLHVCVSGMCALARFSTDHCAQGRPAGCCG